LACGLSGASELVNSPMFYGMGEFWFTTKPLFTNSYHSYKNIRWFI